MLYLNTTDKKLHVQLSLLLKLLDVRFQMLKLFNNPIIVRSLLRDNYQILSRKILREIYKPLICYKTAK